jgi:hypothetical protein
VLELVISIAAACAAPAADPRPAPFDLTYLPRATGSVIAARPAELVKRGGAPDKAYTDTARRTLGALFAFFDGDLKAAATPALSEIDTLVTSATVALGIETNADGTSMFNIVGLSSGVVRTTKPFDWTNCVKKWFPKAEAAKHAGRAYFRVPVGAGDMKSHLAFFVPDDRTLVFEISEDELKALLARLEKKLESPAPPGWDEVNRDLLALCHDTAAEGWLRAPAAPKRAVDRALVTIALQSTSLALGFTPGDETRLRVIAHTKDADAAREVSDALKLLLEDMADADDLGGAKKLFAAMKVKREKTTVRATGALEGNLLRQLLAPSCGE